MWGKAHTLRFVSPLRRNGAGQELLGGVSERHFQPHQTDQAKLWGAGERRAWWFNPEKAQANAKHKVVLSP